MLSRHARYVIVGLALAAAAGSGWFVRGLARAQPVPPEVLGARTAPMQARVIDARTGEPLAGAEIVIAESGQRFTTGTDGRTPEVQVPILRDPRFPELIAEMHGELTLIAYKNGYRDTIYYGLRAEEGLKIEPEVWMYAITPEDSRLEPWEYHVPVHRLWAIQLVDRFRSQTQPGMGPQRPD